MVYDIIIVGAGPGGSSAATFLARQGLSVLLLDRADFPREKVCGDGLAPQALYWLDVLGCVDEVLDRTNACITAADVYVDGERVLTGTFPQDTPYPGFCTMLERKVLDHILLRHAQSCGALFMPRQHVRRVFSLPDGIGVEADTEGGTAHYAGKLLIGADGANSVVSRAIGNAPRRETRTVSLRAYYQGVQVEGSQFKVYFDRRFFPGYGWVFADDGGLANIGVGYATNGNHRMRLDLKKTLAAFIRSDLRGMLRQATPRGAPAGGWACFSQAGALVADRVLLVGDAANLADPLNGGGIHKAIESAYIASQVAAQAVASGDCSRGVLARYEQLWQERNGLDRHTGDLFLAVARNPDLRELWLLFLQAVGRLSEGNRRFQDLCVSFFLEATPRSAALSPWVLLSALPLDPAAWLALLQPADGRDGASAQAREPAAIALSALRNALRMTRRVATRPLENVYWAMEVVQRAVELATSYANTQMGVRANMGAHAYMDTPVRSLIR